MKAPKSYRVIVSSTVTAVALVGLCAASLTGLRADPPPPTAGSTNTPPAIKYKITGAELYSIHCNRCHPERYPTERTSAQWKTIMLHMQVRANIPNQQAKLILKYLQDNSGR